MTTRRISIFGATGSIGQNTLDLVRRDRDKFRVVALSGAQNIAQLAADAREFGAEIVVTSEPSRLNDLRDALAGTNIKTDAGAEALMHAASVPVDLVMSAIVGAAGIGPSIAALRAGNDLALANKETMVAAGRLARQTALKSNARLLPVDSEHSALFQCLQGENPKAVDRVIITASGGAFRDWPEEDLVMATPAQAQNHPNWDMGQRITIDSASMFNKALEVIEAKELFDLEPGQIEVLIHPESIIHAIVGFVDGGFIAHMGLPDMRHAIGYALNYPARMPLPLERLDFTSISALHFTPPGGRRHKPLNLAQEVMGHGGLWGAAFNGAKERALDHFIAGKIGFLAMADLVEAALDGLNTANQLVGPAEALVDVLECDHAARKEIDLQISKHATFWGP